jgi:hypothetical protein
MAGQLLPLFSKLHRVVFVVILIHTNSGNGGNKVPTSYANLL